MNATSTVANIVSLEKKVSVERDSNPWPLQSWWSYQASWKLINLWVLCIPVDDEDKQMNRWTTAGQRCTTSKIITVLIATYAVAKVKPENNSGWNGIQTHVLCGAVLCELKPTGSWSVCEFGYVRWRQASDYIKYQKFELQEKDTLHGSSSQLWMQLRQLQNQT